MRPYTDDSHLNNYVFEESFVLELWPAEHSFVFRLDVAPSNTNPRWHPPPAGDAITLWPARLMFDDAAVVDFRPSGVRPTIDANGEKDYGGFDQFDLDQGRYVLAGEWGDLVVAGGSVRVVLDDRQLEA